MYRRGHEFRSEFCLVVPCNVLELLRFEEIGLQFGHFDGASLSWYGECAYRFAFTHSYLSVSCPEIDMEHSCLSDLRPQVKNAKKARSNLDASSKSLTAALDEAITRFTLIVHENNDLSNSNSELWAKTENQDNQLSVVVASVQAWKTRNATFWMGVEAVEERI